MNRNTLIVAILALLAIVGAYFLGRAEVSGAPSPSGADTDAERATQAQAAGASASPAPPPAIVKGATLPPPGTPLKDMFASLQARANAGDANAASRLVRELDRCNRLGDAESNTAAATNELTRNKTDGMTPAQLRTYQTLLDTMEVRQDVLRKNQAICAGVTDAMRETLVPNIAQAARLGDEDARSCYLDRGPLYDPASLLKHPESLRSYAGNARSMIDAGLAAGDWRVVDLLQRAYQPGEQDLLAGMLGADPVQHYRYLKLYRLGAEPHRVAKLDQQIAQATAGLTSAQLVDADAWAQDRLRGFQESSTSATPEGWETCAF